MKIEIMKEGNDFVYAIPFAITRVEKAYFVCFLIWTIQITAYR
jgi:hypothetical protein